MVDRALANGRAGVCFVLDMTWLASGTSSAAQVMKYEAVAESVFSYQERPLVTLVQYHHTRAMEYLAVELLRIHAMSIVGHIMRRNPQHVDAEEYLRRFIRPKRQPNAPATAPLPLTPESRAGRLRLGRGPRLF
jgi:hypothetical protein